MFAEDISSTDDSHTSETLEHDGAGSSKVQPYTEVPSLTSSNLAESELNLKSCDVMARGISSMLGTVIRDFDCRAENTVKSQDQLSFAINRLTGELDRLLEDAPLPFIMQHASKISGVRKRVSSLNSLLKSIQRRIDNIDQLISAGLSHEKHMTRNVGHQQH